ncbi:alanine racemase [Sporosarcina sp. YIM B06819]|uniref:alanine racemase n=1 Tax=Sporosarcina sp. YIM B06819 TaxID=3081769 RepID=UPI00298D266B|nr:alanine racemase [Sporosarcina sp. YIM B06819]
MRNSIHYRPTRVTINLDAIKANIRNFTQHIGSSTEIIAVVKANGYGHGDVEVAIAAFEAGAKMVSVATPDEAVRLRMAGIGGDILVMGAAPIVFAKKAAELGIIITVSTAEWLQTAVNDSGGFVKPLKIHVKIDSGMGRIGLRDAASLESIVSIVERFDDVQLDGIFTHFACADEGNHKKTEEQFAMFMDLVQTLPEKPRLVHASNSAAALLNTDYGLDAVRFGISLYGVAPSDYVAGKLPFQLERSLQIESELVHVKLLEAGSPISYGGTYETVEDEWIGTIPIGYADGLRRGLRGQEVLVGGERAPIVGTICMDQCMVKLPYKMPIGEKVMLIGCQGKEEVTMEEWAERLGTIPYEIAVSIAERVPRIYIGKDGQST